MEVPGRLASTCVCIPCDRDGLKEQAYGFCMDCQEHLCEACYKNHRRPRPLRNHVLLDKDSMPDTQKIVPQIPDNNNDLCQIHQDKPLEFYCNDHKFVACYVCVTIEHKQCKVDYIPDISGNLADEMNNMLKWMGTLVKKCKSNIKDAEMIIETMDQSYNEVVEEIKLFRKEINEYLDRMEARIIGEADTIREVTKQKNETIMAACEEINEEVECVQSLLCTLNEENEQNKLFIEMRDAEERLAILTDTEKQVIEKNKTDESIKFTRNTGLLDKLKIENNYGMLSTYTRPSPDRTINLQYKGKVKVKSSSDRKDCYIGGIAMTASSRLIVADSNNKCIKMIDIENDSVVSKISLSSNPIDVITLPEDKLAMSLIDEKCIQTVSYTEKEFVLDGRIEVGETCNGLAHYQDKIVVCCRVSKRILIVNFAGDILITIYKPELFYGPMRVVISNDKKYLYIADTDWSLKNRVVKTDWEGNVESVFEEPGYNLPYGMQLLEDGTMLVGFRDSNALVRLSSNLKKCEITGDMGTNINHPKAIIYSGKTQKLYVSCYSKCLVFKEDIIREFKIALV